ncbi:M23 family metallopeptidase [Sphingomonas sp. TZW2008]|uniref:M23 family metallopeptidase n=1 Tax=Sphingomonas sp. TZW2008 TaxID=1917973 RepID=UPI000A2674E0|nr:M23 family metallopeptidase [Sphingomonas sp. TZW2008]
MTRLGATILGLIVLVLAGFASMVSFGGGTASREADQARVAPASPPALPTQGAPLAVPVAGVGAKGLVDTWGQSRAGGLRSHQAIDIPAPGGTPVVAAAPGTVEKLFGSVTGGTTLYVRSPDRAWSYYYAHLAGYAPGVREGLRVKRGTLLGFVGDTGNAGAGNTHLHFGVSRMRTGDRWYQGEPRNPYPLLAGLAPRR